MYFAFITILMILKIKLFETKNYKHNKWYANLHHIAYLFGFFKCNWSIFSHTTWVMQLNHWQLLRPVSTGQTPFLMPNQQCQSTENKDNVTYTGIKTASKVRQKAQTSVYVMAKTQKDLLGRGELSMAQRNARTGKTTESRLPVTMAFSTIAK